MTEEKGYNKEWIEYYVYLEELRQSGATNMFGAAPYLEAVLDEDEDARAQTILMSWMENYDQLVEDGIIQRD